MAKLINPQLSAANEIMLPVDLAGIVGVADDIETMVSQRGPRNAILALMKASDGF